MRDFPTSKRHKTTESDSKSDDEEPTFSDSMTDAELEAAIREYQEWVAENYPLDITLEGIPVDISTRLKRTAGKVSHIRGSDNVKRIRYAKKAYQKWGWEKFAETIRHELIHVHTIQNHQTGGHGRLFKAKVPDLDTTRHCESFASDDAKYKLFCTGCGTKVAEYFKKCKTVKNPDRYRSKCCKESLRVETQ
ncbi:hypothetical protein EWF95_02745 [Halonotius roseus]|uniref:SprT-like domain-containing protein n=2 Tax=Halonotius roseus TaxID=2511997 RepID=A0A544QR02_9EURY|nr:hypothetical protein EWF95_02745 [Halonotius roseus]